MAWHSVDSSVYHDNQKCTEGNNIEDDKHRDGDGGKTLCDHCARLNRGGN